MGSVVTNILVYYRVFNVNYCLSYCIFKVKLMCQLETVVHCKNVAFFTFNYLYLAHNVLK